MSFLKNPFRKSAPGKPHNKPLTPATGNNRAQPAGQGAKPGANKSSLPKNYLDPNSMF